MNSLDIFADVYLENLAESLNVRAHSHEKERAIAVVVVHGNGRNANHSKKRYIEAEQDSAERTRNGEELNLR